MAAGLVGRQRHEDGDCRVVGSRTGGQWCGVGDFEHKGAATSDGLVGLGLRVGLRIVIGGVQEESIGLAEDRVV